MEHNGAIKWFCALNWPVTIRRMENDDVKYCGLVSDGYMIQPVC